MLRELTIRNLAVIEQVTVDFHSGFHVLSGETGAGKSIIIDSLALAAGGRGVSEMIRHGCDKATVEAVFELAPQHPARDALRIIGIDVHDDEAIIIRRDLQSQGKSLARINGQSVTLSMLKEVGEHLVNIHGQHEHQSLLRTDKHLEWLDLYAGDRIEATKQQYRSLHQRYTEVSKSRKAHEEKSRNDIQMLDLYQHQLKEISSARLKAGEEESLLEERRKLTHAEKLTDAISEAYDLLYGSKGLPAISRALARIQDVAKVDPAVLQPLADQLQNAYYIVEDASYQLRDYKENIEFNPERLAQIETRLDLIHTLKRKYGDSVGEILQFQQRIKLETEQLDNREELLKELAAQEAALLSELAQQAKKLSDIRRVTAGRLSKQIEQQLSELQMERSVFEVKLSEAPLTIHGTDVAEFLLSTNPGEPPKPLAKIASGGEMSRVMLALKAIFAAIDQIPVLVFDEVDTGVSGRAAQAIAEKLSLLSRGCQVFSITHLPQVACMADYQYEIRKQVSGEGRTYTSVQELEESQRVEELARMLGGVEVTEKTRHHAQEMLTLAQMKKSHADAKNA